jgi:hypothetical protein
MREMWGQGWAYDSAYLDDVDKVSVDDIYRVSNEIFGQKSFTVVIK